MTKKNTFQTVVVTGVARPNESWKIIRDFPKYEVSNYGLIRHIAKATDVTPSQLPSGDLRVGLVDASGKQRTRSVRKIVAEHFVRKEGPEYDTVITRNGDVLDCRSSNLEWRPRGYAWHYARQFMQDPPAWALFGYVFELNKEGLAIDSYPDIMDAAQANGLLYLDVWVAVNNNTPVPLTNQRFRLEQDRR